MLTHFPDSTPISHRFRSRSRGREEEARREEEGSRYYRGEGGRSRGREQDQERYYQGEGERRRRGATRWGNAELSPSARRRN